MSDNDYLHESLKGEILGHFVVDPVRCYRVIGDVFHIRVPKVQSSVEHSRSDSPNHRMLLALNLVELFHQLSMMVSQFSKVVKHVLDETIQSFRSNYRRVRGTQCFDVHL